MFMILRGWPISPVSEKREVANMIIIKRGQKEWEILWLSLSAKEQVH